MTTPENSNDRILADRTGEQLVGLLLPTILELADLPGLTVQKVRDDLKVLEEMGIVALLEVGWFRPDKCIILTDKGLNRYQASEVQRTWLGPAGLRNLVRFDLHKLQGVKDIVRQFDTGVGWALKGIHLHAQAAVFATAEHHRTGENAAYTVFICTARMDTERAICHRLEDVPTYLKSIAEGDAGEFRPSRVCIVAPNEWVAHMSLRLAVEILVPWVSPASISAWCHEKGGWSCSDGYSASTGEPPDMLPLRPSRGRLIPQPNTRKLPGKPPVHNREPTWDDFNHMVTPPKWSGRAGYKMVELLTLLGDFPVAALGHYKALAGEGPDSSRTERRLKMLLDMELVEVAVEKGYARDGKLKEGGERGDGPRDWSASVPKEISPRGQGEPRYRLTAEGMWEYVQVNGGTTKRLARRTELNRLDTGQWNIQHQDCVYETLTQVLEMGCHIAIGWHATITLADGSWIFPDGAVEVYIVGWGMWWCHLEVELSDRSPTEAEERCRRYASKDRLDTNPVLFVLYNETAEANFHAAGRKHGLDRLFTTTMKRLADGRVGGDGVWSHYGTPVTLMASSIYKDFNPGIYTDSDLPWEDGDFQ